MFKSVGILSLSLLCAAAWGLGSSSSEAAEAPAKIQATDTALEAYLGSDLFFTYNDRDAAKPFLYPIYGPDNLLMVRNYPMKKVDNEETDHPHQKALWFTHGDVNGVDYWTESGKNGRILHQNFIQLQSGDKGIIESLNYWVKPDGRTVQLKDQRKYEFFGDGEKRYLDLTVALTAIGEDAKLGDTKEGTFGIRIAESMRLKGGLNKGHIVNSEGHKEGAAWGKRAAWVDYYGPVQDHTVGIAILDHPENLRFPTWWHARDYGLFAANPFGIHDFEPKTATGERTPPDAGNYLLKKDETLTFKYRVIFHKGNETEAGIAEEFRKFTE